MVVCMGRVVETEEPCQLRLGGGSHDVIYAGEVHTNYLRNPLDPSSQLKEELLRGPAN